MTIHPALDESELYDEPAVVNLLNNRLEEADDKVRSEVFSGPPGELMSIVGQKESDSYLKAVNAAMDILSYRVILLLSVIGAIGLFGMATWNPDPWRLGAAAAFSIIVVAPLTFFYARR